jgi:serpin B
LWRPYSSARKVAAILTATLLVAACAGAVATPTPSSTLEPTAAALPSGSPDLTASPDESPTGSAMPVDFAVLLGNAKPVDPATDWGLSAGTEISDFGLDLLRQFDSKGNLCVSPTSIALALAMTRPGARGATVLEMDKVLHSFGGDAQAGEIVALLQQLSYTTNYDDSEFYSDDPHATPDHSAGPTVELDISNQVFAQEGMTIKPAFLDALSSTFGAGVGQLDFLADPEAARQTINRWASLRTKGRIPEILQPRDVDHTTRIALANAIYLKAGWVIPFDPEKTASRQFTRPDGSRVSVPTMALQARLDYGAGKGYHAVELPFSEDTMSMTIVEPDDMAAFVKNLTAAKLDSLVVPNSSYSVDLTLPRFSANTRVELSETLKAMGMRTAFDQQAADFSGITEDERLYIGSVVHQANIDVVEEGTTASAVTVALGKGVMGDPGPITPPPHVVFHVNKPFLYFIKDNTGAILFMGRIDDPSTFG